MNIEHHEFKDRIVVEFEENEFILIAHLIEKSSQKMKQKQVVKNSLSEEMNKTIQGFLNE